MFNLTFSSFKSYSRSPDRNSIENDREFQKREKRAKRFQTDKNAKSWGSPSAVRF